MKYLKNLQKKRKIILYLGYRLARTRPFRRFPSCKTLRNIIVELFERGVRRKNNDFRDLQIVLYLLVIYKRSTITGTVLSKYGN